MQNIEMFSKWYGKGSHRAICTPGNFAREHLFYVQEIGHIWRLNGNHERQRSALNSYLFVAVCAGRGELIYEKAHYPLATGDCFWIDCRHDHCYHSSNDAPWELRWVHFNGLNAPAFYQAFREQNPCVFHPENLAPYSVLLEQLFRDDGESCSQTELLQSCHITSLLTQSITAAGQAAAGSADAHIESVRHYLTEHFVEHLTLDQLAQQFLMSKFYLARQFKAAYDMTVMEYIISQRITFAKQLLRETEKTIAEVSAVCGYSDQNFFSRQFSQIEGITPVAYRKAWK
ncbi:MAG: AraC family transcriptional regulator [Faecalibacterium sp.]|jgi:AraC-like DNA-binding protein|nr:AraC family transcriptional regulator [Faecalibacterium sp.]